MPYLASYDERVFWSIDRSRLESLGEFTSEFDKKSQSYLKNMHYQKGSFS